MSERLLTVTRWALAALFLSVPVAVLTSWRPPSSEMLAVGLFLSPWVLAALGVVFRVPAARGFAIGVSTLGGVAFLAASGFEMPRNTQSTLLLMQWSGLLLALPAFGPVFGDNLRLRWTAATIGLAIPPAVAFALFAAGGAQLFAWCAVALIGFGVIGLAFQRTWSLLAFLGGALAIGLTPFIVDADPFICSFTAPAELGWIAGIALASAWIPWLGPMFWKLRS